MKKRIVSLLMALTLCLTLLPTAALAANNYNVYIGGEFSGAGYEANMGTGSSAKYYVNGTNGAVGTVSDTEPANWNARLEETGGKLTLTLKGFNYQGSNIGIKYEGAETLYIVLEGENTIKAGDKGIRTYSDLHISKGSADTAKLTITSGKTSILASDTSGSSGLLTIENVALDVTASGSTSDDIIGIAAPGGVTIKNSTVSATGTDFGIKTKTYGNVSIAITNSTVTAQASDTRTSVVTNAGRALYSKVVSGDYQWRSSSEGTWYDSVDDQPSSSAKYLELKPPKPTAATPTATFTANGTNTGTLTGVESGMEYSLSGSGINAYWRTIEGTSVELTGVTTTGIYVRQPKTADTLASDIQKINVTKGKKPSGVSSVACTNSDNNDGQITGVDTTMEYKKGYMGDWTPCTGDTITGLTNGYYYVRVKASGTVLASDDKSVSVARYAEPATASVTITYEDGTTVTTLKVGDTLKANVANAPANATYQWIYTDGALNEFIERATKQTYTLAAADEGRKIGVFIFEGPYDKDNNKYPKCSCSLNISIAAGSSTPSTTVTVTFDKNCTDNSVTAPRDLYAVKGGTLSTLPSMSRSGYTFGGWYLDENCSADKRVTAGVTTFSTDTTLYAKWTLDSTTPSTPSTSGGSSSSGTSYAVSIAGPAHGTVKTSCRTAEKGDTVTLTVTPDTGYTLESLTVLDKDGNEIELTDKGNGTYTFKMPAGKVEVKAAFMDDNTMLNFFVDVPADAYYYDAVLWAAEKGITGGRTATTFDPYASCTRAQIVTFLWRAAGCPEPEGVSGLADVSSDAYYAKAVAWAVENGITNGFADGTFGVNTACTRAQAVAFLFRFAAANGMDAVTLQELVSGYGDAVSVPGYALSAFNWALAGGIVTGSNGDLMPNNTCTRAQIVTFLYRLLGE